MSAFPIALAVTVLDAGGSASTLGSNSCGTCSIRSSFAPVGGVWVDRLPSKTILIFADAFRAVMGSVVIFINPENISMWILGGIVVLMGVSDAFGGPAAGAIIPSLLARSLTAIRKCSSRNSLKGSTLLVQELLELLLFHWERMQLI